PGSRGPMPTPTHPSGTNDSATSSGSSNTDNGLLTPVTAPPSGEASEHEIPGSPLSSISSESPLTQQVVLPTERATKAPNTTNTKMIGIPLGTEKRALDESAISADSASLSSSSSSITQQTTTSLGPAPKKRKVAADVRAVVTDAISDV